MKRAQVDDESQHPAKRQKVVFEAEFLPKPKLPMFKKSLHTRSLLARMAITALAKRLASGEARADFLTKLIAARDDNGQPLPEHELSAEALSLLVAGSDTTSKLVSRSRFFDDLVN